ncbi:hypothetical protein GCM10029976_042500 [Kribbella albertanoniae]
MGDHSERGRGPRRRAGSERHRFTPTVCRAVGGYLDARIETVSSREQVEALAGKVAASILDWEKAWQAEVIALDLYEKQVDLVFAYGIDLSPKALERPSTR